MKVNKFNDRAAILNIFFNQSLRKNEGTIIIHINELVKNSII